MPASSVHGHFHTGPGWFVWPPVPAPSPKKKSRAKRRPAPPPVAAPAPPKPKPPKKKPARDRELPADLREVLDDRLEAKVADGTIRLVDDGVDLEDSVEITLGEFNRMRLILLREEFVPRPAAARPTNHPPGSAGKVAELARRAAAGEGLAHRHDADPLADDRRGLDVTGTGKGERLTVEVHGWAEG